MARTTKTTPKTLAALDLPMLPFTLGGTALWTAAGLALLPFRDTLAENGHGSWLPTCLAGALIGVLASALMVRHDNARRRRRCRR